MNYKKSLLLCLMLLSSRLLFCMGENGGNNDRQEKFEYFIKIPEEIQNEILKYLDFNSVKNIRLASKCLKRLIKENELNEYKKRANSLGFQLVEAIEKQFFGKAQAIINSGNANINFKNKKYGYTPLIVASKSDNINILSLLLDHGASLDICDNNGDSVLVSGSFIFNATKEHVSKLLIETYKSRHGQKLMREFINLQNSFGYNALIYACQNGSTRIVELLVEAGASLDLKNGYEGYTGLVKASYQGYPDIVKILINAGANLDLLVGHLCKTALMYACEKEYSVTNKYKEIAKLLVDAKANVNLQSKKGDTALMYACRNGDVYIVKFLIDAGADAYLKHNSGYKAFDFAQGDEIKKILKEAMYKNKFK